MAQTFNEPAPGRIDSDVRALLSPEIFTLAQGECWLGVAKADITPAGVEPLAGYSWSGAWGRPQNERLWARALYLEDIETGERAVICIVDLLSASAALLEAVEGELAARGRPDLAGRVILSGTHTHSGPGRFFGNRFYDRLASAFALGGFQRSLTRRLGQQIARACIEAASSRRRGELSVQRAEVWRVGRNRSILAYRRNAADPEAPVPSWGQPPADLNEEEAAVDPRLCACCARVDGKLVGAFAWFGCHGTALGRKWNGYHRDWLGVAVDVAERELEGALCAVGSGASGDVTPLPSGVLGDELDLAARRELLARVGQRIGAALVEVARAAPRPKGRRLSLSLDAGSFEVVSRDSTPRWQVGVPVLGGSEDGGPSFRRLAMVAEGFRGDSGPQRPKSPALGFLQALTLGPLDVARHHPWHRLRLGDHVLCTVPGEPTVIAALTLEQCAVSELGVSSATIVGYAGDYAGYFTTRAEYELQHYEGASTLYGPRSLDWYRAQLVVPSRPRAIRRDPPRSLAGAMPRRNVQRLLEVAHELAAEAGRIDLSFACAREPVTGGARAELPSVRLEVLAQEASRASPPIEIEGVCRPHLNPDPDGAAELETFVASFARSRLVEAGLELSSARLVVSRDAPGATPGAGPRATEPELRAIVVAERADAAGRQPESVRAPASFNGARRAFLGLGLLFFATASLLLADPAAVLERLGWASAQPVSLLEQLMTRNAGLTFLLLGINFLVAKNARDRRALSGYAQAAGLWALSIALFAAWGRHDALVAGASGAAAVGLAAFAVALSGRRDRAPTVPHAHWEFWAPLFWLGLLTLIVGAALVFFPRWFCAAFGIDVRASDWLRLYGAGFWVNTLAMWRAQYTRDLRVVSAQLWGSLLFDSLSPALLALAIARQVLSPAGLLLLPPFLAIVWWLRDLLGRADRLSRLEIEKPRTTTELGRIVRDARRAKKLVRVLGSQHSAPRSIFGDTPPGPRGPRPSDERSVHVSLDELDHVVDVDRTRRRISVEAGLRIGVDPGHAPSAEHNLLRHLRELGWALGDLGGIVHQTVGGFLSTGSAGGSVSHAFHDAVVELRFVDACGRVRVARRGAAGETGQLFEALVPSMGLLGIITEVTFECEALYAVEGRELTATVREGVVELPEDAGSGAARRVIRLSEPGEQGLAAYLSQPGYRRILWWPQAAISAMVVWEARRSDTVPSEPLPYRPPAGVLQFVAGRVLTLLGWSYGVGNRSVVGNSLRRKLLPPFAKQFLPREPRRFHAAWDDTLPMDTHVDQAFLPVDFTELWFDIERTFEVMRVLLAMYRDDPDLAGTFAVELYAAKREQGWLHPGHGRDSFRVDIFWYQRNDGDPVIDYYPRFYERLAPLAFRAHWGKYLPEPGSARGADDLARRYPRWDDFAKLRRQLDPEGTFLSTYWRRHLGF